MAGAPKDLRDTDFLQTMRARYKLVNEAEKNQDQRERHDIAFEAGDQWPATLRQIRLGQQPVNGMPAVPARPTLVFDKVKEPVRQILNQERAADIGIQLTPADDFGDLGVTPDDTEILLREGLIRRIQRESHAKDARTWAYKRAVIAGRGYYIVRTRFLPGRTWDQEIYVDRILHQEAVKIDPSHQLPNASDAEWEFIGTWVPWEKFKAEYPRDVDGKRNPFVDCSDDEFMGLTEEYPLWYEGPTGEDQERQKAVRVVDYWYLERTERQVAITADGRVWWAGPPPAPPDDESSPEERATYQQELAFYLPEGMTPVDTRYVVDKTVKFCKVAGGFMEIERTTQAGGRMPIVKVVGEEVLPHDNERHYEGMIRPAIGSQQAFNYMTSKLVEVIGLAPIPPMDIDPEAIDGYEEWFNLANVRAFPYLPSRTYDDQGRQLKPVTRLNADPNIQPIAASIGIFDTLIKSTTSVPDSTLGNVDPTLRSGKAIQAVVQNAQLSTSNFLDNLVRAMEYETCVINEMLYPIYGTRPGRLVRILTGEGDEQAMAVGALPPQMPQPSGGAGAPPMAQRDAAVAKVAKLTKDAKFNVAMKLAKSTENRRQQFVEMFGEILAAAPEQMTVAGDLFYKNMDIPDARQLAKRQKLMLAPAVQAYLAKEEQGQAFDPQAQAQIAQMQQQLQQLTQLAQQQQQAIQTKQAEIQGRLQEVQIKAESDAKIKQLEYQRDLEIQRMQDATTLAAKQIEVSAKGVVMSTEARNEALATHTQQQHEVGMLMLEQAHQREQADRAAAQQAMTPPASPMPLEG